MVAFIEAGTSTCNINLEESSVAISDGVQVDDRMVKSDQTQMEVANPMRMRGGGNEMPVYEQHPLSKAWSPFEAETFDALVTDIKKNGLQQNIYLYEGMILDGWNRYRACIQAGRNPKDEGWFSEFSGNELQAAEFVQATGIRRSLSPEKRYATFLKLLEMSQALKAKYDELEKQGKDRKNQGQPLCTGTQRVDLLKVKADVVGVGRSTAAKVEKAYKIDRNALNKIIGDESTTNQILGRKLGPKKGTKTVVDATVSNSLATESIIPQSKLTPVKQEPACVPKRVPKNSGIESKQNPKLTKDKKDMPLKVIRKDSEQLSRLSQITKDLQELSRHQFQSVDNVGQWKELLEDCSEAIGTREAIDCD